MCNRVAYEIRVMEVIVKKLHFIDNGHVLMGWTKERHDPSCVWRRSGGVE